MMTDTGQINVRSKGDGLRITMSATLENIDEADMVITPYLESHVPSVDVFAVRIIFREAVLNAVLHGSGNDPDHHVEIYLDFDDDGMSLKVEDQGSGFDWFNAAHGFDIMGDGGRGLALMKIYSSAMTFNEKGNCVMLRRDYASNDVVRA